MEELANNFQQTINRGKKYESEWENEIKMIQLRMEAIIMGTNANTNAAAPAASPHQMKKRPKRLSAVVDKEEENDNPERLSVKSIASDVSTVIIDTISQEEAPQSKELHVKEEPEHVFARPMRAAKLKIDSLKEVSINHKMRRPDNPNETVKKIKKENETRSSQIVSKKSKQSKTSRSDVADPPAKSSDDSVSSSKKTDESLLVLDKENPVVELFSEEDDAVCSTSNEVTKKKTKKDKNTSRGLVVKVKKEKLSGSGAEKVEEVPVTEAEPEKIIATQGEATPEIETGSETASELVAPTLKHEATTSTEDTLQTTETNESSTANGKRKKKKPFTHRPIKEERVSTIPEANNPTPVSTRTRSNSITTQQRAASVYEDAIDKLPQEAVVEDDETPKRSVTNSAPLAKPKDVANETIATNNATMVTACDATFVSNQVNGTFAVPPAQQTFVTEGNPNATITVANMTAKQPGGSFGDATFDVRETPASGSNTKNPNGNPGDSTFDVREPPTNDSIMTEDDSFDKPLVPPKKIKPPPPPQSAKVLKAKAKPNELFNPCVQSPVKKKVEAFEHHAQKATDSMTLKTRSKKAKENSEPELPSIRELKSSTSTTPLIGKPHAPALGRFLTPTQQSNLTPSATNSKKLPNSASKIMPFPTSKQISASSLKQTSSTSSQSLSRENSEEDLKKGYNKLQQLADERKKKRELKHQQAALQREAKEKERAERLRKIVKEREEKNRKKALEMEQKKRELEEINRNLKQQEEREQKHRTPVCKTKMDPTEIARQERELLEQMKMPQMKMPLPPKQTNKYNFNMLHSDDSTDDEGKTTYKRPNPPPWSRAAHRADCIACQAFTPSDIIDSFFSVQPMTPDLKAIFPNIDARYLKRNSSAIWRTPPRYSEMPKY